jgi:leucyl-tRNA synthetase
MVAKYGADTVRLFSMFAAPPEQSLEWNEAGVDGMARFLRRLWASAEARGRRASAPALDAAALDANQKACAATHETIGKVGDDYGRRQQHRHRGGDGAAQRAGQVRGRQRAGPRGCARKRRPSCCC